MINPNGDTVDEHDWYPSEVNARFPKMMYVLIVSWAMCIIIGIIMVFTGPIKSKNSNAHTVERASLNVSVLEKDQSDSFEANT